MTSLNEIKNKLETLNTPISDIFTYNFDCWEYRAEELINNGYVVERADIESHIEHISTFLVNFDKLTKEEQRYYAAVDCARMAAILEAEI